MPKKFRKTRPVTPVVINRPTEEYYGFHIFEDADDNVTVRAFYRVPQPDGTIDVQTRGVDSAVILTMPEFFKLSDKIMDETE